jgi:ferredoxin
MIDYIILGTGLSSFAATIALIKKGICPTIIDYSSQKQNKNLKANRFKKTSKTFYGDDFATKCLNGDLIKNLSISNSYAYGGHSNIWGGSIDTNPFKYFSAYNFDNKKLKFFFNDILKYISLEKSLNFFQDNNFDSLLKKDALNFKCYESTIALDKKKCIRCDNCLFGCEYDAIFNSKNVFEELELKKLVKIKKGYFIKKIERKDKFISIETKKNNKKVIYSAKKVYCGLGSINTSKLLLRSNLAKKIIIKDSQNIIYPLFNSKHKSNKSINEDHSLSKLCMRLFDDNSHNYFYGQIYAPSNYTLEYIRSKLKINFKISEMIDNKINKYLRSIYFLHGYLPSEYSSKIVISKEKDLIISKQIRSFDKLILNYTETMLKDFFKDTGFTMINFLKIITPSLHSYHFGASLPMKKTPSLDETDIYGQLKNFKDFHIIDSTILPTIPSTSISSLTMLNSYRIAFESC